MNHIVIISNRKNYIAYLKQKCNTKFEDEFKNRASLFFSKYFDDEGFITIDEDNKNEYIKLVNDILDNKFNHLTSWFPKQNKLFLNDFYYETAFNASNRIEENVHYEDISKTLYEIAAFTLSPTTFLDYLEITGIFSDLSNSRYRCHERISSGKKTYRSIEVCEYSTESFYDLTRFKQNVNEFCTNEKNAPKSWFYEDKKDIDDTLEESDYYTGYRLDENQSRVASFLSKFCNNLPLVNNFTSLSYKLLSLGHLKKRFSIIIEHPNYAFARIATTLKITNHKLLDFLYKMILIPSTPMFYNSLTRYPLLTSCFLLDVEDDTNSIALLLSKIVSIQKHNSGIGINLSKLRSSDQLALNGEATALGIEKFVKTLACTTGMYKNSLRQRSSSANLILSIEHPEIISFINLKSPDNIKGTENTFNLFNTIKISDEFMYRLLDNKPWYLISPNNKIDDISLSEVWGKEYSNLYIKMIERKNIKKIEINSFELYQKVIKSMKESGSPFQFFTDTVNSLSNHKNYGMINGTNLCTEILEYHDEDNTACCNICSINLKMCVAGKKFDFDLLSRAVESAVDFLTLSIKETYYSHSSCSKQNLSIRPIGIGIQGLANAFQELGVGYIESGKLYSQISEVIYYSAVKKTVELAKKYKDCDPKKQTPLRQGEFAFELFYKHQEEKLLRLKCLKKQKNYERLSAFLEESKSYRFYTDDQWDDLRKDIKKHGIYNTLLIAYMPTSLSSGIYGNVESFEPYNKCFYRRSYAKFDIATYNTYLVNYLLKEKLCSESDVIKTLIKSNGEFMKLPISNEIKEEKKHLYKGVYDYSVEDYVKFISLSNPYVDQGKSTNLYVRDNLSTDILKSTILHWLYGSKTTYYFQTDTNSFKVSECQSCTS